MSEVFNVQSIGVVSSAYTKFGDKCDYQNDINIIQIDEKYTDGLMGTELFSNLFCIYYQHLQSEWKEFAGHKSSEQVLKLPITREPTCRGVFSKRSPARPAKLGSCIVTVVKREGRSLYVKGLDAMNGSPVLDIKPYVPQFDAFPMATAPMHWCVSQTSLLHSSRSFHWDTVNVTMTLGLRAGVKALRALDISRGDAERAVVKGPAFFAHGIEAATGCSVIEGAMELEETESDGAQWTLTLVCKGRKAGILMRDGIYSGADEVITLGDDILFERCDVLVSD
ncbi:MAG TPA: TrmO family methyltransferase [Spirochaetota bacterium]